VGMLNNSAWTKPARNACEVAVELLLSALHLFFSYTQQQQQQHQKDEVTKGKSSLFDFIRPRGNAPKSQGLTSPRIDITASKNGKGVSTGVSSSSNGGGNGGGEDGDDGGNDNFPIDFEKLRKSQEFKEFTHATSELQLVDPSDLSDTQSTAFFINVYNLLVIHGYIHVGFPMSLLEWRYFSRFVCYTIGTFPYTLDCIHRLLRGKTAKASFIGDHLFSPGDPRASYLLPKNDPRVHFLLCMHNVSSPRLRVIFPLDNLDVRLSEAASEYCQKQVEVDTVEKRVVLPALLDWYKNDFEEDNSKTLSLNMSGGTSKPLLTRSMKTSQVDTLVKWLSDEQKKKIANIVGENSDNGHGGIDIAYKHDWTPNPTPPQQ